VDIRNLYKSFETKCGCKNVYCTTCGGLAHQYAKLTFDAMSLINGLKEIKQLSFTPSDFKNGRGYGYPREPEAKQFIIFLQCVLNSLPSNHQQTVVDNWAIQSSSEKDFIIDGIGYYLIPAKFRKVWEPILIERSKTNASIEETLLHKYNDH
jgi:hypothetical protein